MIYLIPEEKSLEFFKLGLQKAREYGIISAEHEQTVLSKIMTYEEFVAAEDKIPEIINGENPAKVIAGLSSRPARAVNFRVEEMVTQLRHSWSEYKNRVEFLLSEDIAGKEIRGDMQELFRSVHYLMMSGDSDNFRKYGNWDDGKTIVEISIHQGQLVIKVTDHGPGHFQDAENEPINPHHAGSPGMERVAENVVEGLRGDIRFKNIRDEHGAVQGAQFTIEVPLSDLAMLSDSSNQRLIAQAKPDAAMAPPAFSLNRNATRWRRRLP